MKLSVLAIAFSFLLPITAFSADLIAFKTDWLSSKPEVLTYRSTNSQGEGLFQLSSIKTSTAIEVYINIVMPGFTKTISGTLSTEFQPVESVSKIIIGHQIIMNTNCFMKNNSLEISTTLIPYNIKSTQTLFFKEQYIDFSQIPFIARALDFTMQNEYTFASVNPRTNTPSPVTIKAVGDSTIHNIDCLAVELTTFEGTALYWMEKNAPHRILLIMEASTQRKTELIL